MAQFSDKHALSDIHITKHVDKATPKLMTPPPPPTTPLPIPYPTMGAQQ